MLCRSFLFCLFFIIFVLIFFLYSVLFVLILFFYDYYDPYRGRRVLVCPLTMTVCLTSSLATIMTPSYSLPTSTYGVRSSVLLDSARTVLLIMYDSQHAESHRIDCTALHCFTVHWTIDKKYETNHDNWKTLTNSTPPSLRGVAYSVKAYQIPLGSRIAKGVPLPQVLPITSEEQVNACPLVYVKHFTFFLSLSSSLCSTPCTPFPPPCHCILFLFPVLYCIVLT